MATRLFGLSNNLPSAAPRILKVDLDRFKVLAYDIDNGYPQRMESLIKASPTAKMCTQLYADYVFGQGFSVTEGKTKYGKDSEDGVWNTVVNSKGQTGDDILSMATACWSKWEKFYLHLNYNALFAGVEVNFVPYATVRHGIDEEDGKIALYDNWWNRDRFGRLNLKVDNVAYIDKFNPDPVAIKDQVRQAGGWNNYKGQIFEWSKNFEQYPECTLDSAIDAMQAEILSYQTTKSNIKNNFGDKVIWKEKGKFQTQAEEDEFNANLKGFLGPDGDQVIVCQIEQEGQEPEITPIENKLDDKKFEYTDTKIRSTIYRLLGQNAILHSDLTQGRYNQNQLPEAIKAYNNRTERDRISMQRAFKQVFGVIGIESDCAITPIEDTLSATQNTEGANNNVDPNLPNNQG